MNMTTHANIRSQQRCIPPLIDQWLDQFGETDYDGQGGIRFFFSKASIKKMEKVCGHSAVKLLSKFLHVYKVISVETQQVITIGYLTKRINRR